MVPGTLGPQRYWEHDNEVQTKGSSPYEIVGIEWLIWLMRFFWEISFAMQRGMGFRRKKQERTQTLSGVFARLCRSKFPELFHLAFASGAYSNLPWNGTQAHGEMDSNV